MVSEPGSWAILKRQRKRRKKLTMYRVAQIKISHRTNCNFSTTVWDFYTKISWFIRKISCYNSEI